MRLALTRHPVSRPADRFETLDAMRGITALAVMQFHYLWGTSLHLFSQAYYGVDFFFCLSGAILVHAYEPKIADGMSFFQYARQRLIRLYPFYLIGFVLGSILLLGYLATATGIGFNPIDYLLSISYGALALPYPNHGLLPFVGGSTIPSPVFPTNIPAWSLFFEIVASAAFFPVVRWRVRLSYLVVPAFLLLVSALAFYRTENLGWGTETFFGGFPRVVFMFFLGAMIYRWFRTQPCRIALSPWALLVLIAAALAAPPLFHGGPGRAVEAAALVLLAPGAVLFGLMTEDPGKSRATFRYLGWISYGIYVVHWPIYHLLALLLAFSPATRWIVDTPVLFAGVATAVALGVAHVLTSRLDEPLREWLRGRGTARRQLRPALEG